MPAFNYWLDPSLTKDKRIVSLSVSGGLDGPASAIIGPRVLDFSGFDELWCNFQRVTYMTSEGYRMLSMFLDHFEKVTVAPSFHVHQLLEMMGVLQFYNIVKPF